MMEKKWFMILCALGIHLSIGSLYAWSQVILQIQTLHHINWSLAQITFSFSLSVLTLGLTAALCGSFVEKYGARISGIISAIFFSVGLILSGIALKTGSISLLYLGYGLFAGIGIGIGYITPISTLLKWFDNSRGLAMGLTIMGFGFGAMLEMFLIKKIFPELGVINIGDMLMYLGGIYGALIMACSIFLVKPKINMTQRSNASLNLPARKAVKSLRFYLLWIMLFINITCGIAVISVAEQLGINNTGMSLSIAATLVFLMSVFNGLGRFIWAFLSDYISRKWTYVLFFALQILAFYLVANISNILLFSIFILMILSCYGGGFSLAPAFIADIFGTKEPGTIHGYILTAWAAAGIFGPMLITIIKDYTGNFSSALYVFSVLLFIGLVISVIMLMNIRNVEAVSSSS